MRVTNNMLVSNYLSSLNKSLEKQNSYQEMLSDGKAVHRPSDDPIKVARLLKYRGNLAENEQFTQNVKDALSRMETADGVMSSLSSITIRAQELVTRAASANPDSTYEVTATELDQLINEMISLGNTKIGDKFVFAGQAEKTLPFKRESVGTPPVDTVVYYGDDNKISLRLQPGAVDPEQDSVNLTGVEVFGPAVTVDGKQTLKVFEDLIKIKNDLLNNRSALSADITVVQNVHSRLLTAQSALGTRMSMYEMAQNMLEARNTTITGDIASVEDIDMAKAIMELKNSENVYSAALSVGARILPKSLADFLS